ncbi:transporter substrate-binding domain-containing protein [Clostridiaceae bacterium UIB06]|uniref:Transporter substrate-binding domain-containing protein n=1 Tax=Clostridium thailandense TaxID=2794346 RepID=A0A949U086_9CLOT|nr:transporter substrate-binding domain-containing protein [Clostridium thailandense]MBV7274078.1 transporter substrate-binding domain-containing protein [Clostridium thailandense]MCH5137698.1 transporter substrate-binding domain-containing protein [Clostridiaceae bacterium UIB06]
MNKKIRKALFFIIIVGILIIVNTNIFAFQQNAKINGSTLSSITVALDNNYPPYAFKDSNGNLQGVTVDQWKLWEKKTGIQVKLQGMPLDEGLNAIKEGKCDVIDDIFFNEERARFLDYSKPHANIEVPIFFHKNISGITGINSLKGFKVAVQKGDNSVNVLKKSGITDIQEYNSCEDIIEAAKEHKIVTFIMDKPIAVYYLYKMNIQDEFNYTKPVYSAESYRAVKKGNTELLDIIEKGFEKFSNKDYKEIDNKWFGNSFFNNRIIEYIKFLSIAVFFIILILIIWNLTLKKRVRQKTVELVKLIDEVKINEEKYRALLKAIPDIFFVIGEGNIFVDFHYEGNSNDLYIMPDEFLGKSIECLFPQELCQKFTDAINDTISADSIKIIDYSLDMIGEKKFYEARLLPFVNNSVLAIVRDITERKTAEEKIYMMSIYDDMTGFYNRNYFEEEMNRHEPVNAEGVGIVICDLDGLKLVNDTLGHPEGDKYLITVSDILKTCFREQDIIGRIGGDEFAVLMEDTSAKAIEEIRIRINEEIKEINKNRTSIPISISFGYSVSQGNGRTLREMLKEADKYMYREKLRHHQSAKSELVHILTKMLEVRDFINEGHADRLQELVKQIAEIIGMSQNEIKDMQLLAHFHDIGKIAVPNTILFKPGRLSEMEMIEIKRHSEIGFRIAESSPDLKHISEWIYKHHEWWNGNGYPFGLKGEEIPIQCRILSIIDAYDAMTNDRPYRRAMTKEAALREIKKNSGVQFDPFLVEKFIDIM